MKKTISTNQLCLLLIIFIVSLKLSVLPAITCDFAGTNAYVVSLIALIVDFALIMALIIVMQKIPDKSFYELLSETVSKAVAKIVYVILFLYFFCKLMVALLELHDYYIVTLFEHLNPIFFIIALMFLLLYLFNCEFRTLGRMIEILFFPLAIGISFTLIYPIAEVELVNLLPLFTDGFFPISNGLLKTSFAYGDYMLLFVLMGNIKFNPKSTKKLFFYVSLAIGFVFNFYIIFVGAFGETAVNQSLALSELPLHNPYPTTIGRLEWLTIIMWTAILLVEVSIIGCCCTTCLVKIFGVSDRKVPTFVLIVVLTILYFPTYLKLEFALRVATSAPFTWVVNGIHIVMLILFFVCYYLQKKSKASPQEKVNGGKKYVRRSEKNVS